MLALHHFLDRHGGDDVQRHAGVVAFAVAGRAFDDRIVTGDAGLLRGLRNIVDIGAERDHRLASPHDATHAVGMPAMPRSILKPSFSRMPVRYLRGFEFLKAELAEAEDAIDHHLRLLLHVVDFAGEVGFHAASFSGEIFDCPKAQAALRRITNEVRNMRAPFDMTYQSSTSTRVGESGRGRMGMMENWRRVAGRSLTGCRGNNDLHGSSASSGRHRLRRDRCLPRHPPLPSDAAHGRLQGCCGRRELRSFVEAGGTTAGRNRGSRGAGRC